MNARGLLEDLVGQTVYTVSRRQPNRIIRIDGDSVVVGTERSPEGEPVPIESVQDALDRLQANGEIEVSVDELGYRSAFIGAVLAEAVPTEVLEDPVRLALVR